MTVQPLVALDIGSTKVACAVALPHERSPGFELLGTTEDVLRVREGLEQFWQRQSLKSA